MGEEEGVQSGRRGKASDAADRRFRRVDRNGDGVVDAAEYEAHLRQHIASASRRLFKQLDRDGDGKLSKEEFTRIDPELATLEPEDRDGLAGESRREPRMRNRHEVK
jgi:hypothetical protein